MEKTYRIRTEVNKDKYLPINLRQDVDTLEILSLNLNVENFYKLHTSNYGVIVGRVLANDGFGIPNTKISVFIELSDEDAQDTEITNLYPYTSVQSFDNEYRRYNLLPDESNDSCYRIVGTFPNKRLVLDNDTVLDVYDKYWKYTTVTNNAGDYMIFGIPTGNQNIHVDLDLSDIGVLSQKPHDMYFKGYNIEQFDSPTQFKESTNLSNLTQIISQDQSVYVYPFWGDEDLGEIGITRCDIDISYKFEPTCVFMGSLITDNNSNFIGHHCSPSRGLGRNNTLTTGEGTIEMIRKTLDNAVEEYQIKGNRLIDSDGVWCYQIPMNLDYVKTDEFGNVVPTDNPNKGIPTRARVRFRLSYGEGSVEGQNKHRGKILIPNNPPLDVNSGEPKLQDSWGNFEQYYKFGSETPEECYRDLFWNKVYSIKSFVPRFQTDSSELTLNHSGLKDANYSNNLNPLPFNKILIRMVFPYTLLCFIFTIVIYVMSFINSTIMYILCVIRNTCLVPFPEICIFGACFGGWCLLRLRWFLDPLGIKLPCIGISSSYLVEDGTNISYFPGCNCQDDTSCTDAIGGTKGCKIVADPGDLEDKVQEALSQEYDITHLDFYNDWINGTVYLPLWGWKKTKKKKYFFGLFSTNAVDAYCECNYNGKRFGASIKNSFTCGMKRSIEKGANISSSDNNTTTWINKYSTNDKWPNLYTGVIRNVQNDDGLNLYYYSFGNLQSKTQLLSDVGYVRLYSTDLILLGSFNDCDLDGIPKLYRRLPTTTANIPFIVTIKDSSGKQDITGMDWLYNGSSTTPKYKRGLFFNLGCFTADTTSKTCINAERMSELGVTLDMSMKGSIPQAQGDNLGIVLDGESIESDGMITRAEIYDNETRYMFATLNHLGLSEEVTNAETSYPTYRFGTLYPMDFDGSMTVAKRYTNGKVFDNADDDYINFRMGDKDIVGRHGYSSGLDNGENNYTYFPLYNNSFFMYFGLNEGSTALDKFLAQYDASCYTNKEYPFYTEITTTNGKYFQRSGCTTADYGTITVTCNGISLPYTLNLYDSNSNKIYTQSVADYETTIVSGNVEGFDTYYLANDTYTVEIIDKNDNVYAKKVTVSCSDMSATVTYRGLSKHYEPTMSETSAKEQETTICDKYDDYGEIILDDDCLMVDDYPYHIKSIQPSTEAKEQVTVSNISVMDYYQNTSYDYASVYENWKENNNYLYSGEPDENYTNIIRYDDVYEKISKEYKTTFIRVIVTEDEDDTGINRYGINADNWNNLWTDFQSGTIKLYSGMSTSSVISTSIDEDVLKGYIENWEETLSSSASSGVIVYEKLSIKENEGIDKICKRYLIYGLIAGGDTRINYKVYSSLNGYDVKELYDKYISGNITLYEFNYGGDKYTELDKDKYKDNFSGFTEIARNLWEDAIEKSVYIAEIEPSGTTSIEGCASHENYKMKITLGFTPIEDDYTSTFDECDCDSISAYSFNSKTHYLTFNLWKPTTYSILFGILPTSEDKNLVYDASINQYKYIDYTYENNYTTTIDISNANEILSYINGMPTKFMNDKFNGAIYSGSVTSMPWYNQVEKFAMSEVVNSSYTTPYNIPLLYDYSNKKTFESISALTPSYDENNIISNSSTENIAKNLLTWLFDLLKGIYITENGGSIIYKGSGGKGNLVVRAEYPAYDLATHKELDDNYVYNTSVDMPMELVVNPLMPNIIYNVPKYQPYTTATEGNETYYRLVSGFNYSLVFNTDNDNSNSNAKDYKANYFGVLDNNAGFEDGKFNPSKFDNVSSSPSKIYPLSGVSFTKEMPTDLEDTSPLSKEIVAANEAEHGHYFPIPTVDRRLQHRIIIKANNSSFADCLPSGKTINTDQYFKIRTLGGILLAYNPNNYGIIGSKAESAYSEYIYSEFKNPSGGTTELNYNDDYYVVYGYNGNKDLPRRFYSFKLNGIDMTNNISGKTDENGICVVDTSATTSGGSNIRIDFKTCSYDVELEKVNYTYSGESGHTFDLAYYSAATVPGVEYSYSIKSNSKGVKRQEDNQGNTYTCNPTSSVTPTVSSFTFNYTTHANAYYLYDDADKEGNEINKVYIRELFEPNTSISRSSNLNYIVGKPTMVLTDKPDLVFDCLYTDKEHYLLSGNSKILTTEPVFINSNEAQVEIKANTNAKTPFICDFDDNISQLVNITSYTINTDVDYEPYTNEAANYYNKTKDGDYGAFSVNEYYYTIDNNKKKVGDKWTYQLPIVNKELGFVQFLERDDSIWGYRGGIYTWHPYSWTIKTNMTDSDGNMIIKNVYFWGYANEISLNTYNSLLTFDLVKYMSNYTGITYENSLEQTIYQNSLCTFNYYPMASFKILEQAYDYNAVNTSESYSALTFSLTLSANTIDETVFKNLFKQENISHAYLNYIVIPLKVYDAENNIYPIKCEVTSRSSKSLEDHAYRRLQFITDDIDDDVKEEYTDNFRVGVLDALSGGVEGTDNIIKYEKYEHYVFPFMIKKSFSNNSDKISSSSTNNTITYNFKIDDFTNLVKRVEQGENYTTDYAVAIGMELNISFKYDPTFYYCFKLPNDRYGSKSKDMTDLKKCYKIKV